MNDNTSNSECDHDIYPSKIRGYGQCKKCGKMFRRLND